MHKEQQDKSPHRRIETSDRPFATAGYKSDHGRVQGFRARCRQRLGEAQCYFGVVQDIWESAQKSAADLVKESELASTSLVDGTHDGAQGTLGSLKHHIFQVVSKVTSEPVDWETWVSMSDAESLQKYPEVRISPQVDR